MTASRHRLVMLILAAQAGLLAASAGAVAPPALAGTTVVTGSRSAWTAVRLPRAVDFNPSVAVQFTGRGRFTGLLLKKEGRWNSAVGWKIRIGYCGTPGCDATLGTARSEVFVPGGDGVTGRLPAGTYRLYLITDGAPVKAVLRLPGLSGVTRPITPRTAARSWVLDPKPTVAEPAAGPLVFAAGSTHKVPGGGGINITDVWKDHPVKPLPSSTGVCKYFEGPPPPGGRTPAYHYPCEGGFPTLTGSLPAEPTVTPVGPGRFVSLYNTSFLLPPGEFAFGGYSDTPSAVTSAHVHQLWLDF